MPWYVQPHGHFAPFLRNGFELMIAVYGWEIGCLIIAWGLWRYWRQ